MSERAVAGGPAGTTRLAATSKWLALTAMMFAVAMTFIDQTIVAIAAPNIQTELSLSSSGVTWTVNSYLLALAAGFALGGRLADVLGVAAHRTDRDHRLRRVVHALRVHPPKSSLADGWIIVFRAMQGLSAALMIRPRSPSSWRRSRCVSGGARRWRSSSVSAGGA